MWIANFRATTENGKIRTITKMLYERKENGIIYNAHLKPQKP